MITNNLWEESSDSFNCSQTCGIDQPFIMPLLRTDLVGLRFQIPYQYIQANAGGIPVNASVTLKIVDEAGTTDYCDLGAANSGRYLFGYVNDNTNKVAQYQIYCPIPMVYPGGTPANESYTHAYIDVSQGDWVKITGTEVATQDDFDFIYGVDPLPNGLYEISPGRIVYSRELVAVAQLNYINNVLDPINFLYGTNTSCAHEGLNCFRFKLTVSFSAASITREFYTKPFRILRCDESTLISSKWPVGSTDCLGYRHSATWNISDLIDDNLLFLRIPADVDIEANRVKKFYNARCYNYKAEITRRYRLKSDPVPDWFASESENIIMGTSFAIDNVGYLMEDSEQIFQNNDFDGSNYQYIDLPLSSCKCEKIFVC